ncbi:MAG TPA: hypothetical protein VEB59_15070 [Gemmatimonadales bacterium]|nr:hypothetical protein [Gemmatimonadales bacterium]
MSVTPITPNSSASLPDPGLGSRRSGSVSIPQADGTAEELGDRVSLSDMGQAAAGASRAAGDDMELQLSPEMLRRLVEARPERPHGA